MKKRWPAFLALLVLVIGVFVYLYFLHPETVPMWADYDPGTEQNQSQNQEESTPVTDPIEPVETTDPTDETETPIVVEEETTPVFNPVKKDSKIEQPITYMFFGQDRVVGEENGQEVETIETDLILTATLDPENRNMQVQFIPPNTLYADQEMKYIYGEQGVQALETAVEDVTEQDVQIYIGVDYQSFVQLIDVLGGIDVELDETINMQKYGLVIEPGVNHLNGEETLKLVRLKWGKTTALERIERQKVISQAIYDKMREMKNLSELKEVSDSVIKIRQDLETNLQSNQILKGFQFFTQGVNELNVTVLPGELVEEEWIPKEEN